MPIYVLTGASGRPDPLASDAQGTFVLGAFLRSWFYWAVSPVVRTSIAVGLGPTFYNLLGVAFGIGAGVAFATGCVTLGGWGVLLGGMADVLDGRVARARGIADRAGAFLDSTLDRFAEVGVFVGLAVLLRSSSLTLALVVIAMGGSLLVSYARARGESQGVVCKLGVMQRAERLLLLGFGGLLDPTVSALWGDGRVGTLLVPILGLVAVGTVGTAIFRTVWIARALRASD
jgi:CDP-diacylglycerol--glycerol-3-phosphate 3-phosphatidyltransferase